MLRLATVLMIAIMAVFVTPAVAQTSYFPGGFAATVKGVLPSGVHFTRLAMYSFQPGGTLRQDFWYWQGDAPVWSWSAPGDIGSMGRQIGYAYQASYPYNFDQYNDVIGSVKFSSGNPTTLMGTWAALSADTVQVDFGGSGAEIWKVTWSDPSLAKIELVSATYVAGSMYYISPGNYNVSAVNAGWGFGGPGVGFTTAADMSVVKKDLPYGKYIRHNSWACTNEPVSVDSMNLGSFFVATTNDVLRYVTWDSSHWVFSYLAKPFYNSGTLATRISYQTSHDYNNNGFIWDDVGHTYSGLQIIDQSGAFRGIVFADVSPNGSPCQFGDNFTISAMYYLDTPN